MPQVHRLSAGGPYRIIEAEVLADILTQRIASMKDKPEGQYWSRYQVLSRAGWKAAKIGEVGQLPHELGRDGTWRYLRSLVREWERTKIAHLRRCEIQARWDARRARRATDVGLADLDSTLMRLREEEDSVQRAAEMRRSSLLTQWGRVEQLVKCSLQIVGEVLTKHGYVAGIEMQEPRFLDDQEDAYGARCALPDVDNGSFAVTVSDGKLHIHRCTGHYSTGYSFFIQSATVDRVASAIAETTKWLIVANSRFGHETY